MVYYTICIIKLRLTHTPYDFVLDAGVHSVLIMVRLSFVKLGQQ